MCQRLLNLLPTVPVSPPRNRFAASNFRLLLSGGRRTNKTSSTQVESDHYLDTIGVFVGIKSANIQLPILPAVARTPP